MIKLSESKITDILPSAVAEAKQIKALAYAVTQQIQAICVYADGASTYATVASVPEKVLDYLAIELRTPTYDETYSVKIKRELVQETLIFYTKMGTPSAVNQIIESVFGSGYITEWWEYDGDPYHFKATTTNPSITGDDVASFRAALESVKRLSAWLDEVVLELSTEATMMYVGTWLHTGDFITIQRATM